MCGDADTHYAPADPDFQVPEAVTEWWEYIVEAVSAIDIMLLTISNS
jgi:hypothetical protein